MFQLGTITNRLSVVGLVLLLVAFNLLEVQSGPPPSFDAAGGYDQCGTFVACDTTCVDQAFTIILDGNPEAITVKMESETVGNDFWYETFTSDDAFTEKTYVNRVCSDECIKYIVKDSGDDGLLPGFFYLNYRGSPNACYDGAAFGDGLGSNDPLVVYNDMCSGYSFFNVTQLEDCISNVPSLVPSNVPSVSTYPSENPVDTASEIPTASPSNSPSDSSAPSSEPTTTDDDSKECFSGEMEVIVQDKGPVKMKSLQVGDYVKTGNGDMYEQIYAFAHRVPQKHAKFLQFHTSAGAPLEVTAGHLVFVNGKTNPVRADSITVGDRLKGVSGNAVVEKITIVNRNGIYNPLTSTGTIQVNGITASTFIAFQNKNNEYVELEGVFGLSLSHHKFAHRAIAPFWFFCTTLAFCNEANDGLPVYVSKGIDLIEWSQQQHIALQILMWASFHMLLLASILMMSITMVIPAGLISVFSTFHLQQYVSCEV